MCYKFSYRNPPLLFSLKLSNEKQTEGYTPYLLHAKINSNTWEIARIKPKFSISSDKLSYGICYLDQVVGYDWIKEEKN